MEISYRNNDSPILLYGYKSTNSKNPSYQLSDIGTEKEGWPNIEISRYYDVENQGILIYMEEENEK